MRGSRPLTDLEVAAVSAALNVRDRAMFILGVRTGFRIKEILSLKVKDVLRPDGSIVDRISVERRNMKGKVSGRSVVLHEDARVVLLAWAKTRSGMPDSILFVTSTGKPMSRYDAWRYLDKAYRSAGCYGRLGTHAMRKTFANRVYKRLGYDLAKTQSAMGHVSINSTVSYLSFAQGDIDAAILGD